MFERNLRKEQMIVVIHINAKTKIRNKTKQNKNTGHKINSTIDA